MKYSRYYYNSDVLRGGKIRGSVEIDTPGVYIVVIDELDGDLIIGTKASVYASGDLLKGAIIIKPGGILINKFKTHIR
ncbi:MAG: hypothetical protein FK731_15660 [Asgard group archaeon]|nr:hypothetical protein [Asgard group archaeon]